MKSEDPICEIKNNVIYANILMFLRRKNYLGLIRMSIIAYLGILSLVLLVAIATATYSTCQKSNMLLTPVNSAKDSASNELPFNSTVFGQIGDAVGGLSGPFIAIIAAVLTYLAFMEQVKANKIIETLSRLERQETITTNRADICLRLLERFESRKKEFVDKYGGPLDGKTLSELLTNYPRILTNRLQLVIVNHPYNLVQFALDLNSESELLADVQIMLNQILQLSILVTEMREGPERIMISYEIERIVATLPVAEVLWSAVVNRLQKLGRINDSRIYEIVDLFREIFKVHKRFAFGSLFKRSFGNL
jgi:hypothetical protein